MMVDPGKERLKQSLNLHNTFHQNSIHESSDPTVTTI
jgi:hypothetical protein